jgi:hypothetical protein
VSAGMAKDCKILFDSEPLLIDTVNVPGLCDGKLDVIPEAQLAEFPWIPIINRNIPAVFGFTLDEKGGQSVNCKNELLLFTKLFVVKIKLNPYFPWNVDGNNPRNLCDAKFQLDDDGKAGKLLATCCTANNKLLL